MKRLQLCALAIAQLAFAGAPVMTELQPRGAEKGRPFTLIILGRDLTEGAKISSPMPASFTPVSLSAAPMMMSAPGRSASFLVEPKADLSPGVYPIRVETPSGISNVLLFSVGIFPEQTEEESAPYSPPNRNDSIETAQPIQNVPVTVNGTLRGPERDIYRIYAKAGEHRVIDVEARRSGSAIDPVLRILDGSGKQIARSEDAPGIGLDARIDFTFPREGNYYVEVQDARFSKQAQNFYRLRMGDYKFAEGIFPLGGKRGETTEVTFFGGNLPAPVMQKISTGPAEIASVSLPGSAPSSFLFASSEYPELIEPAQPVPIPSVINGRLLENGEVDRYRVPVTPGEQLIFEMEARELGTSKIEGVITVYGVDGKKLDSAGDKPFAEDVFAVQGTSRTSSDPFLNIKVPEGTRELTVAVEDLARRGGPLYGYRLVVRRQAEDFLLSLGAPHINIPKGGSVSVPVLADRRGYNGPIQLVVDDLPKGISVEGGYIPRESVDAKNLRTLNRRGVLVFTADPGAEMSMQDIVVSGEGKLSDGTALKRRAHGPAMVIDVAGATAQGVVDRQRPLTAEWLGADLPAAVSPAASAALQVSQSKVTRMEEGDRYDFEYRWNLKSAQADPAQNLSVEIIGARDTRVTKMVRKPAESGSRTLSGSFSINTTKATEPATYDVIVRGKVDTGKTEEEVVARPLKFVVPDRSNSTNVSSLR